MKRILAISLTMMLLLANVFGLVLMSNAADGTISNLVVKYSTNPSGYVVSGAFGLGAVIWSDRAWETVTSSIEEMNGATVIRTVSLDGTADNRNNNTDNITFTINKTADVYVYLNYTKEAVNLTWASDFTYVGTFGTSSRTMHAYKKTFTPGEVVLGNSGTYSNLMYGVAVQFKDDTLALSAITINGIPIGGFDDSLNEFTIYNVPQGAVIVGETINEEAWTECGELPENMIGDVILTVTNGIVSREIILHLAKRNEVKIKSINDASANKSLYEVKNNLQTSDKLWGSSYWAKITSLGVSGLEGSDYITTNFNDAANAKTNTPTNWLTFSINNSAEIYIITNYVPSNLVNDWLVKDGYSQFIKDGAPVTISTEASSTLANLYVFKKDIVFDSGTVDITTGAIGTGGNAMYVPVVKWIDNSLYIKSLKINGRVYKDFDPAKLTDSYYNIDENDNVEVELYDNTSTAEVNKNAPDGKVTITVSNTKGESKVYTFNKNTPTVKLVGMHSSVVNESLYYKKVIGMQEGQVVYPDRSWETLGTIPPESELIGSTYFTASGVYDGDKATTSSVLFRDTTTDWMTLNINHSANVYILTQCSLADPDKPDGAIFNPADWMDGEGWTLLRDDSGYPVTVPTINNGNKARELYVFKKTFGVLEGENRDIILKTLGPQAATPYIVALNWTTAETKTVQVNVGANGTSSKSGANSVFVGDTLTITVTPDSNYELEYIKYNGTPVAVYQTGSYTYTTPSINDDAVIDISFMPAVTQPVVHEYAYAFESAYDEEPYGIVFATARTNIGEYNLDKYGMVFSKTDKNPVIGAENCITAEGTVARNMLGQYGIKFIGAGIEKGKTYFARAYAIYINGSEAEIVYGNTVEFIPGL